MTIINLDRNTLDKKEKYFGSLLIWRLNHQKLCQQNFTGSLTSTIIAKKSQIYSWIHKFQETESVNNLKKKAENIRSPGS